MMTFAKHVRIPPKRYYIGGFKPSITEDKIYRYVTLRGPSVTMVRIFKSKRNQESVVIRLNVEPDVNANLIEQQYFWPQHVVCRPWVNRGSANNRRGYKKRNTTTMNNMGSSQSTFRRNVNTFSSLRYIDEYNPYLYPEYDE